MQTSPRSFLDGAHKLLSEYARRQGIGPQIGRGSDLADRCWKLIERHRFNVEPPPAEVTSDIMNSLKLLIAKSAHDSTQGTSGGNS
jgi:hypothetical protein